MWNVKRVLILVAGVIACIVCYAIYALFLGNIDAMQPLPIPYTVPRGNDQSIEPQEHEADKRLAQSFGPICEELQRPLRLWLADKLVAIAAGDFIIEKDGRVKLAPFSAALYHKTKTPNAYPEISTIRADIAILTLDQPVSSYAELNSRKVIAVEMIGRKPGISLTNNRRTAEKGDDIDVLITNGNLFYEERKNLIWTDGVVCLKDFQTKPPTEIRGKGMEMHLSKEVNPNQPRVANARVQAAPPANDNGGVETIKLHSDVDMHFWVDGKSGFLGGPPNVKNNTAPPPEKAHVHIRTGGPFFYNLVNETAWFESPPVREGDTVQGEAIAPDQVLVVRLQMVGGRPKCDQLICDRLDLQFRKRIGPPASNADSSSGGDKEIETAKATKRDKNEVVLSLDSEEMAAYCDRFDFRAADLTNGPMMELFGEPLKSFKDGHKMVCPKLFLRGANRAGEGQEARAQGPGVIDLIDGKNTGKPTWPTHVVFNELLTVVKEKEGGEVFDLMTVTGDAAFIDDQQKQELHGEKIRVWIRQVQESAKKPEASGGPRQEVHRVIAEKRVHATSPEFIIRKADVFTMIFLAKAPPGSQLPAPATVTAARPNPDLPMDNQSPPPAGAAKAPIEEKKKPEPPIELTANTVNAEVFTLGAKKELRELVAKGNVYVFQPGDKPGEKRIDIIGQLLTVNYAEKGHILVVHGDQKNLGRLEMNELILWGPIITIDRGENKANVAGHGAMQMPSDKNLDGTDAPKNKKAGRVTIYWNQRMDFDGRSANFYGGVQAFQQDSFSKMQCEHLTSYFDKFVSFKEGATENRDAKLDRIICDKNVYIDDTQINENKQLLQRNIITGSNVASNNNEGGTNVTGPGEVRGLGRGSANVGGPPQPIGLDNKPAPTKQEWKLTHVKFRDRMWAPKTQGNNKSATFYGMNQGVEVFHFPTRDINATMNADRPPPDSLYLRCGMLQVEGRQQGDRTTQFMKAQVNCVFRTDKYFGEADIITYNEETDIMVLEAKEGNRVRLYEFMPGNQPPRPMSINSSKVLYNRKAGTIESAGVRSITN